MPRRHKDAPTLAQQIAEALMHRARVGPPSGFTTISALARQYSVSHRTMSNALAIVKARGKLVSRTGKGVAITDSGHFEAPPDDRRDRAARECADRIETAISRGDYRIGTALPKGLYLTAREHISTNTLTAALRILEKADRIHKRGKRWYAGPAPRTEIELSGFVSDNHPVVLLVFSVMNLWYRISSTSLFASPFYEALEMELKQFGIATSLATMEKRFIVSPVPSGFDEIHARIDQLGKRYAGAVLYVGNQDAPMDRIRFLMQFGKPVVAFDPVRQRRDPTALYPRGLARFASFYRLYNAEETGTRLMLNHLARLGHRHIAVPRIPGAQPFIDRRIEEMQRAAGALDCGMEIMVVDQEENGMFSPYEMKWIYPDRLFGPLQTEDSPSIRRNPVRAVLFDRLPAIKSILNGKATAIVACNGSLAQNLYFILRYAGITLRRDISLIGLDQSRQEVVLPISSVDFGFSEQGYRAAHIFIRDIPTRADDRWGNIASRPRLLERGSVGRVRRAQVDRAR